MVSILTLALICATIVLCLRQRGKVKVRLAEIEAGKSGIVLHADARTGEVLDGGHLDAADPDDDPNMGTNQRGHWLEDGLSVA